MLNFRHWRNLSPPTPTPYETSEALTDFNGFGQLIELRPPYPFNWFGQTDLPSLPVRPMSIVKYFYFFYSFPQLKLMEPALSKNMLASFFKIQGSSNLLSLSSNCKKVTLNISNQNSQAILSTFRLKKQNKNHPPSKESPAKKFSPQIFENTPNKR